MTARRWFLALAGVVVLALVAVYLQAWREVSRDSEVAATKAASVTHLLVPGDFPPGAVARDFGVTANGEVVLEINNALRVADQFDAGEPRLREIDVVGATPDSFALDAGGTLLGVRGGYFGALDETGSLGEAIPLPFPAMQLAPSAAADAIYLFGGAEGEFRVYHVLADGRLRVLLRSNEEIVAVADSADDIFVATRDRILKIRPRAPELMYQAPEGVRIRSLAVGRDGQVFFATEKKVFALAGPNALSVVNNAGGSLRLRGDTLFVLDPRRRLLFELRPADASLFKEIVQ